MRGYPIVVKLERKSEAEAVTIVTPSIMANIANTANESLGE